MVRVAIVALLSLVATEGLGYLVHTAAHRAWSGVLYRTHLKHHTVYTPADYVDDEYRNPGASSFVWWYLALGVVTAGLLFWLAPMWLAMTASITMAVVGAVNSFVHDAFHIRGHWLEHLRWFNWRRELHYVHHVDVRKNLGIYTFWFDRLFKSFRKPSPAELARIARAAGT